MGHSHYLRVLQPGAILSGGLLFKTELPELKQGTITNQGVCHTIWMGDGYKEMLWRMEG
jgi:hypothetical protein